MVVLLSVLMLLSQMSMVSFAVDGDDNNTATAPAEDQSGSDAGEQLSGIKTTGTITVRNTTGSDIFLYGKDQGNYGEWKVEAGKSLDIGLQSFDRIYAGEAIKLQNVNPNVAWSLKSSGSKYSIEFAPRDLGSSALSFDVVSDASSWKISFMPSGGKGTMEPQMIERGSYAELRRNAFTKDGYVFAGWSEDKNAKKATYADGYNFTPESDVTLYAVWKKYVHTHDWNVYTDKNNNIYISCRNEKCDYPATITLTLNAENKEYDGIVYQDYGLSMSPDSITDAPEGFSVPDETSDNGPEFYQKVGNDWNKLEGAPKDAGNYKVKVFLTYNGKVVSSAEKKFTITPKTGLKVKADDKTKLYNAPDPELTYTVEGLAGSDLAKDVLSGELSRNAGEDVGGYYITQGTLAANGNYVLEFEQGILTIGKSFAKVTKAPEAKQGLVYNRAKQALIEPGEAKGGTLLYYKGATPPESWDGWSTEIPTGSTAKDFDIWYGVKGNDGYTDVPAQKIENVKIAPKELEVAWSTDEKGGRLVYNGQPQKPSVTLIDPDTGKAVTYGDIAPEVKGEQKDVNPDIFNDYHASVSTNNTNYVLTNDETDFRIDPKSIKIEWSGSKFVYNGEAQAPTAKIVEGLVGEDKSDLTYDLFAADEKEKWVSVDEAVNAGSYMAMAYPTNHNYTIIDLSGYTSQDDAAELASDEETAPKLQLQEFEITKAPITPSVSLEGWTYGDPANDPVVEGNPGGAVPVFTYKVSGQSSYTDEVPTEASKDKDYVVRATLAETKNYQGGYATGYFRIAKAELKDFKVAIDGWKYRDTPNEPVVTGNSGNGKVTFTFYKKAKADSETGKAYTSSTFGPGYYYVTAAAAATDNYKAGTARADFVVGKSDIEYTAPVAKTGLKYSGSNQVLIKEGSVGNTKLEMSYSLNPEDGFTEDVDAITGKDAGTYAVWYQVEGNANYEGTGVLGPVNVTIEPSAPEFTKPTPNVVKYDGKDHALLKEGTSSDGHFEYTLSKLDLGYSRAVPRATEAGEYEVHYRLVGDKNHGTTYGILKCEILKGDLNTSVTIGNWRESEDPSEPELTYNPENAKVTYRYKPYGSNDDNLVKDAPSIQGHYTVVADVAETKNYSATQVKKGFYVAEDPKTPLAVENLKYNGENQVLITAGDAKGTGTMMYSLDGTEYSDNLNEITGKNAGTYTVWYYIEGEDYRDTEPAKLTVSIDPIDAEITKPAEAKDLYYNGEAQQLVTPGTVKGSTMLYNLDGGKYSYAIPKATEAGKYVVGFKAVGDNNHKDIYGFINTEIKKAKITPLVDIKGWTYGDEAYEPSISGYYPGDEIDGDDVTYEYKPKTASDDEYTIAVPENADTYVVRATIKENGNYAEAVSEPTEFTIAKADIRPVVIMLGWDEGEYSLLVNSPSVFGNKGKAEVKYYYKDSDAADEDYAEFDPINGKPYEEGSYILKAVVPATDNYKAAEATCPFSIYEADPEVTVPPEAISGLEYKFADGAGVPQYLVKPGRASTDKGYFDYFVTTKSSYKPGLFTRFSKDVPTGTDAGTYYVWYRFCEKRSLLPDKKMLCDEPVKVTIAKAAITPAVTINGWTYGLYSVRNNSPKLTEESNPGDAKVTYSYKKVGDDDSKYSKIPPVLGNAGDYVVKADVAETNNYKGGSATTTFTIAQAPATAIVAFFDDLVYNGKYQRLVDKALVIGGELTYSVDGGAFTSLKPTAKNAGVHQVTYRLTPDSNHYIYDLPILGMHAEKTAEVEIAKAPIDPYVSLGSWTYGHYSEDPEKPYIEGVPKDAKVTYEYCAEGSEDYAPFNEDVAAGLEVGDYKLKATVAETANYLGGEAEASFTVAKDSPTVHIKGAEGLVYNGKDQTLIESAESSHGTILFRQKDGSWAATYPADTQALSYVLVYRVEGDRNYESVSGEVRVKIAPKEITGFTWTGKDSYEFDGGRHGVTAAAEGIVEGDNIGVSLDNAEASAIGDYTAKVTGLEGEKAGNYRFDSAMPTAQFRWSIVKPAVDPAEEARKAKEAAEAKAAAEAAAKAEAAWNGTYSANIPNAKSVKAKAGKKSFTVKWKKLSKKQRRKFNKIEIQYCSDGSFNRATTVVKEVGKNRKSVKIKGLVKGSVYYVRVRNIKYSYDMKYVSNWSKVKTVKVK